MLSLLVIFALFEVSTACSMPGSEVFWRGKCIKFVGTCTHADVDCQAALRALCAEEDAYPPTFELEEDIDKFYQYVPIANYADYNLPTGLTCNISNLNYTWLSGAPLTYFDRWYTSVPSTCTANQNYFILALYNKMFFPMGTSSSKNYCFEPAYIDPFSGNFENVPIFNGGNATCLRVISMPLNWTGAEAYCRSHGSHLAVIHTQQMNDYIRRSALAHGFKDGLHIGLFNGFGGFAWTDGSSIDYSNYEHGFPNALDGNCGMMKVALGKWENIDCDKTVAPFACTKKPVIDRQISNECPDREYKSGDHLYSPGFPSSANVLCDYFLDAPPGMVVEIELVFLEANKCCDSLILEDDSMGHQVIANLTGWSTEARVYRSSTSHMTVHWRPANREGVRGFYVIFRVADPRSIDEKPSIPY